MTTELQPTEIVTEPARLAFPNLFEPRAINTGDEPKYMATILLPPDFDMEPLKERLRLVIKEAYGDAPPKGLKLPIKPCEGQDADKPMAGFDEGWHKINVSSKYPPSVVDQALNAIIDKEKVYGGCWCRFHLNAYTWKHRTGGQGVSFGLNAVQLIRDDTRLGGRRDAKEVFGAVEVDDLPDTGGEAVQSSDPVDDLLG